MNLQKVLGSFIVFCLMVVFLSRLVFSDELAGQSYKDYLVKESFNLTTNGQTSRTAKSLDPAQVYTIKISSRYNLHSLKAINLKKLKSEGEIFEPNISAKTEEFTKRQEDFTTKLQTLYSKRKYLLTPTEVENYKSTKDSARELEAIDGELKDLEESRKRLEEEQNKFKLKRQTFEKIKNQNSGWQLDYNIPDSPEHDLFHYQTASAILFNDNLLRVKTAYPEYYSDYIYALVFSLRGQGRPLTLRLASDFSSRLGFLQVEISSPAASEIRKPEVRSPLVAKAAGSADLPLPIGLLKVIGVGLGTGAIFLSLAGLAWNKKRKLVKEREKLKRLQILEKPHLAEAEKEIKRLKAELERKDKQEQERRAEEKRKRRELESQTGEQKWSEEKILEFSLTPNLETFTSEPLPKEEWFKIVISGIYKYHTGIINDYICKADACYDSKETKNLIYPYQGIFFDLKKTSAMPIIEDRHLHQYTFAYCGTGNKLSILLKPARGYQKTSGSLSVKIVLFPEETSRIKQEREKQKLKEQEREQMLTEEQQVEELTRQQKQEDLRLEQERLAQEAEQKHEQELFNIVRYWISRVELEPNFFNPEYQKNLAKTKRSEVLNKLKEEWFTEYRLVIYNQELLTRLQQEAPQVLEWLRLRNEVVFEAERLEVTKPPRMTTEEFRDKEIKKIATKAKDDRAKLLEVGKNKEVLLELKYQKFKEIDQREDLDDEQKDELKQVYQNITELSLEDNNNGQEPQVI